MTLSAQTALVRSETERHVAEVTELGYTVVEGVLDPEEVEALLCDTRRLHRELPTIVANSTTIVKGFRRNGQEPLNVPDHLLVAGFLVPAVCKSRLRRETSNERGVIDLIAKYFAR